LHSEIKSVKFDAVTDYKQEMHKRQDSFGVLTMHGNHAPPTSAKIIEIISSDENTISISCNSIRK
jgi:hypothetical protein